ncbi:MAG: BUD32 family EKC/KEOPS complex subunit [Sulfobacillus sp.]
MKTADILRADHPTRWNSLIKLIKESKTANPYTHGEYESYWNEQCEVNFPILYLASLHLRHFAAQKNCYTYLFATRDCCHWVRVFQAMFPEERVHYFNCSRNMFDNSISSGNVPFRNYVSAVVGDPIQSTVYVDIHGSGRRMFEYFHKEFNSTPYCFLLSARYKDYADFPKGSQSYMNGRLHNIVFGCRGSPIEMLNYDVVGTLQNFGLDGPVRSELEYSLEWVKPYHACIQHILDRLPPVDEPRTTDPQVSGILEQMFKSVKKHLPAISEHVKHIGKHPKKAPAVKSSAASAVKSVKLSWLLEQLDAHGAVPRQFALERPSNAPAEILQDPSIKNKKMMRDLNFRELLSTDTVYSLVWAATLEQETTDPDSRALQCVVKMVLLTSGEHRPDSDYFREDAADPFRHTLFRDKKPMEPKAFLHEVESLESLAAAGLAPKVYRRWICDTSAVHYGFIVMQRMDTSLKRVVVNRELSTGEKKKVRTLFERLHKSFVHGDLKPSNVGVNLNADGTIAECLLFDCQKVRSRNSMKSKDFQKGIKHDLQNYGKHLEANMNLSDDRFAR